MRFDKRQVLGNRMEYMCDIFADSSNDVLIVNKVQGSYGLRDEEDICREFISHSLKEINQSPYYSVDLYNRDTIEDEISEAIIYLQEKIDRLKLAREVNNIINKVYEE